MLRVSRISALRTTPVARKIPKAYDYPKPRPVIRKTRSWRGLMQVRFDDTKADRNAILKNALLWAPLRVFGSGVMVAVVLYYFYGHDQFMFMLFGYESEAMVEGRVNSNPDNTFGDILGTDRGVGSPLRALEQATHTSKEFDVFKRYNKNPYAAAASTPTTKYDAKA